MTNQKKGDKNLIEKKKGGGGGAQWSVATEEFKVNFVL